ncbi:DinB family protein [Mucilaginibacter ginsenosidivorax]|uniref:DinB family protein n=1 Tax=Mucilaginibacter ginsenosidivorax TaxID=862126 RepID=A0A5B8W3R0_9SPHI|nr:DinB family protein [Mucilaginibacter ginsenosidivorax]QEC78431.1 DinB family protein [Mucilaginibacter ginsenosidivorax]
MKRIIILTLLCFTAYQCSAQQQTSNMITSQEREKAMQLLTQTESGVFDAVKGLSEAQLNFKPAADKWSVADCIKHIAAAEKELWAMAEPTLAQPANSEKRAEIKFTDDDLIKAVEDRTHKSKTFAALEPANSPYKTVAEALTAFKSNREKLIAFIKNTKTDLRNHVLVLPVGTYDSYQFILLIAAHSNRHTQQINEVKGDVGFPK